MRAPDLRLMLGLSVSTALAAALLALAATASQAQLRGNISAGPRTPSVNMRSPNFGGGAGLRAEPRHHHQRLNNNSIDKSAIDPAKGKGKGQGSGPTVSNAEPGAGGGRRPPKRPRVPVVPVVGTGVAIGTAVVIGAGAPAQATSAAIGSAVSAATAAARIYVPPAGENRFVKDEVMLEFAGDTTAAGIAPLLRRRGLIQLEAQFSTLTSSTMVRARILNGRPVRVALQGLAGEAAVRAAQPNMVYAGAQQSRAGAEAAKPTPAAASAAAIPGRGDPAQYALGKLRLGEAHALANGDRIVVAVIDSGIDMEHPDLSGAFAGSYDAIGKPAPPHQHGTAIAGAIVANARLVGAAPGAKILAIRAFGATGASAEATTMAILKSVEYASRQGARIINMSFAGPTDPGLGRRLAAAKAKGAVLIAATGNFGPKSPPQYPASDPNVIAVSATDADDRMFRASNIGPHVAVAAPGVDILLPSPGNDYRLISGTSFSAAYVSGVVALMLHRAPGLTPDDVRKILLATARDLGPSGRDPEYGAGLVDAYQAIMAVQPPSAAVAPARDEAKAQ
jgi:subtilisin family serine protease